MGSSTEYKSMCAVGPGNSPLQFNASGADTELAFQFTARGPVVSRSPNVAPPPVDRPRPQPALIQILITSGAGVFHDFSVFRSKRHYPARRPWLSIEFW